MIFSQATVTLKRSVHNYLVVCHRNKISKRLCNELCVCKATFSSKRNATYNYSNSTNHNKYAVNNISKTKDDEFQEDFIKGDYNVLNLKHYLFNKNNIQEANPNLVGKLISLYHVVNKELNKDHIFFEYDKSTETKGIQCTIKVLWPDIMSFSHVGENKKGASMHAAWKCFCWLYSKQKIKLKPTLRPILYTRNDIDTLLNESVQINLQSNFTAEMKRLIDIYDNEIKPIINGVSTADTCMIPLSKEEEQDTSVEDQSMQFNLRNNTLEYRLRNRLLPQQDLPVLNCRTKILESLENNQVLLIKGDTGCGKSTQIPQFIIDWYIKKQKVQECNILMSEPRRLAAITLAKRVAEERGEIVGDVVGYQVRLHKAIPSTPGSILFCTTGILLKRLQSNPTLAGISHVIIDEAHERSQTIDILLNLLKKVLKVNKSLKLIIMSATINAELFERYFSCAVINIKGKSYPVKMHFLEDIQPLIRQPVKRHNNFGEHEMPYEQLVAIIKWIIRNKPRGAIMCFLPGWREIKHLQRLLNDDEIKHLVTLPLHSKLSSRIQQQIFDPVPANVTKVILTTDIAESSITVTDVKYVVDTAVKRQKIWVPDKNMFRIGTVYISQANISQRKGRAGRVASGESYHLISRSDYTSLEAYPIPEICRMPLEQSIITSKLYEKEEKAKDFFKNMITPPDGVSILHALTNLENLGIVDKNENLTPLGNRVTHISLEPNLSVALIYSCIFGCIKPVLTIASIYSTDNELSATSLNSKTSVRVTKFDLHETSDHIAMLRWYQKKENQIEKCDNLNDYRALSDNIGNFYLLKQIIELHANELINTGLVQVDRHFKLLKPPTVNNEMIRAILFASSNQLLRFSSFGFKNGKYTKSAKVIRNANNENVIFSKDCVNYKRTEWPSPLLTHSQQLHHNRVSLVSDTSMLSPLTVLLFNRNNISCQDLQSDADTKEKNVLIGMNGIKNVQFSMEAKSAEVLLDFRNILWSIVDYIIKYEGTTIEPTNLQSVKNFKQKLQSLVDRLLKDASRDLDNFSEGSDDSFNAMKSDRVI